LSDCDGDGKVNYNEFVPVCKAYIDANFKFESQVKKQELYNL